MFSLLVRLVVALETLAKGIATMSAALDRLTQEVTAVTDAAKAAETLIAGLAEQIRNSVGDDAALNALADQLDATSKELGDAVTANTPAQATPEAPPAPEVG